MNTTTTTSNINLDYLRLMADGDRDMEQTMLEMLIPELAQEFEKMKALQSAQHWEELGKVSHKMKSTLAFIGNEEMTKANKQIEQLVKSGAELGRIPGLMETFAGHLPTVMEELQATLATY